MTLDLSSLLRITLLCFFLGCVTISSAQISDTKLMDHLLELAEELNAGVRTHDTTALKVILASEYQLTGPKFTQPVSRKQWLENVNLWSFDSATITRVSVSSWDEVAVFRSLQHFYNLVVGKGTPVAKSPGSWVTDIWIKRDGRWQLATRLSERFAAK